MKFINDFSKYDIIWTILIGQVSQQQLEKLTIITRYHPQTAFSVSGNNIKNSNSTNNYHIGSNSNAVTVVKVWHFLTPRTNCTFYHPLVFNKFWNIFRIVLFKRSEIEIDLSQSLLFCSQLHLQFKLDNDKNHRRERYCISLGQHGERNRKYCNIILA